MEETAFYELTEKGGLRLKGQNNIHEEAWLPTDEAIKNVAMGNQ